MWPYELLFDLLIQEEKKIVQFGSRLKKNFFFTVLYKKL